MTYLSITLFVAIAAICYAIRNYAYLNKLPEGTSEMIQIANSIREGTALPDYNKCVGIAAVDAIAEMKLPAIIAIILPVVSGFIMGAEFVGDILIGSILSSIMLAVFCGNSGGAWDNAKKMVEALGRKGYPEHIATVVGDTVGDSLKDTVGPSLDIFIKIMSTVAILFAPIFSNYNLISLISKL